MGYVSFVFSLCYVLSKFSLFSSKEIDSLRIKVYGRPLRISATYSENNPSLAFNMSQIKNITRCIITRQRDVCSELLLELDFDAT